jgi:glycosyltransferase involved in cell wall biosynthesis
MPTSEKLAIIIPAFNEPAIKSTLVSLYNQEKSPAGVHHFVVDNASSDNTRAHIDAFFKQHDDFPLSILTESQKGTGAAVDTGFRTAIEQGYTTLARTDADTVPTGLWSSRINTAFETNPSVQLLGGKSLPLKDEQYRHTDVVLLPVAIKCARIALALKNLDSNYLKVVVGHNLATRSSTYLEVGGFERSSIELIDEDIDYSLKVAQKYGNNSILIDPNLQVETSMRRIRTYGIAGTALHHLFPELRINRTDGVDVR